jgi:hypothetical protein
MQGRPNWYGYLHFLRDVVQIPAPFLPPALLTAVITDSDGNPIIDSNGDFVSAQDMWNIVTDSSGMTIVDNEGSPITGSLQFQWILVSFLLALEIVNEVLDVSMGMYAMAVYNLAADRLINLQPDTSGQTYWAKLRETFKIYDATPGIVVSGSDQGTTSSVLNAEFMKNLTAFDLQTFKTPYGRAYMGITQNYGPSIWGLS